MTYYNGRMGNVKVGSLSAVEMEQWSLDLNTDTETMTFFGSNGWKSRMAKLHSFSATISGKWCMDDGTNTTQQDIQNNMMWQDADGVPNTLELSLYVDATHNFTGTCIPKSLKVNCDANQIVTVEMDLEGYGQLVFT